MAAARQIRVWSPPGLPQVECHRGWKVDRAVPKHWHDEFHIVMGLEGNGDLFYRGAWHSTPAGTMFVMAPGEVHHNRTFGDGYSYRTLNIAPGLMRQAAAQAAGRDVGPPHFQQPVIRHPALLASFARMHQGLEGTSTLLEHESLLLQTLVGLIRACSRPPAVSRSWRRERHAVRRVRDFLAANHAQNVSLSELARLAGLSPYHLNRVFAAETGLPPHAFQAQQRVVRARDLLRQGRPLAEVAAETGFADQSHLTRMFKRVTGLTPGAYQAAV